MNFHYKNTIKQVFGNRTPRARQLEFIEACFNAMASSKPIVIEGPTGLGKSLAMISSFMPFILKGFRVIYTTRTISQLENLIHELRTVLDSNKFDGISASLNIGRESTRKWACNQDSCEECTCNKEKEKAIENSNFLDFHEMNRLYENDICPYIVGRFHASPKADIVLSTYSRVLNESYRKEYMGMPDDRSKIIMIFDEAHNFFEDVIEKPFLDIGYLDQKSIPDTPALNLRELKRLLVSSLLKTTSRYVFDNLRELLQEGVKKASKLLSRTRKAITATQKEEHFKSKDLKNSKERIILIEGTWIPEAKSKLKNFQSEARELESEREDLDHKIEKLNDFISKLQDKISDLSKTIELKYDQIKILSKDIADLYDLKKNLIRKIKAPGPRSIKASISSDIDEVVAKIESLKEEKNKMYAGLEYPKKQKGSLINDKREKNREINKHKRKIDKIFHREWHLTSKTIPAIKENISNNLETVKYLRESCKRLRPEIKKLGLTLEQLNRCYQQIQVEKDCLVEKKKIFDEISSRFYPNISAISEKFLDHKDIAFEMPDAYQLTELFELNYESYLKNESIALTEEAIGLLPDFLKESINYYNLVVRKLLSKNTVDLITKEKLRDLLSGFVLKVTKEGNINHIEERLLSQISESNKLIETIISCPEDFALEIQRDRSTINWSVYALNPKQKIIETTEGSHSSVYLSATVSPVETMATMVSDYAVSCKIESDFPVDNFNSYGVIGVNTSHKEELLNRRFRSDEYLIIKTALRQALSNPVSTGIFVSSKIVLNEIYPTIAEICKEKNRYFFPGNDANILDKYNSHDNYFDLCKKAGFNDRERDVGTKIKLIKYCADLQEPIPVVMIDIIGGQLAEGVNYNDKEMELALLIGIPYPDLTEDTKKINLRIERLMELTGDQETSEGIAFRYTAIRKLAQTCGRVHRSKTDRGTIVLIDERLLGYKSFGGTLKSMRESSVKTIWDIMHDQIKGTIRPITCIPNKYQSLYIPSIGRRQYSSTIKHAF